MISEQNKINRTFLIEAIYFCKTLERLTKNTYAKRGQNVFIKSSSGECTTDNIYNFHQIEHYFYNLLEKNSSEIIKNLFAFQACKDGEEISMALITQEDHIDFINLSKVVGKMFDIK